MRARGFTLIEVLLAAAMLVVMVHALSLLSAAGMKQIAETRLFLDALNRSQAEMERLRSKPFAVVGPGTFDGGKGDIEVTDVSHELKRIRLAYLWHEERKPLEFVTMRSAYR